MAGCEIRSDRGLLAHLMLRTASETMAQLDVWPPRPANVAPARDRVDIWWASVRPRATSPPNFWSVLSEDERNRAHRLRFERDKQEFVGARGYLRCILAHYLGTQAGDVEFSYGAAGKPELSDRFASSGLRFNLSHSDGLALYAVAQDREVGVDLERIHELADAEQIAQHFFSTQENTMLRNLAAHQKSRGFFNCWTRKEALVKGLGDGLSRRLGSFTVSLAPGEPARLLSCESEARAADNWVLRDLTGMPAYAAAVAVQGTNWTLRCREWTDESSGETVR